MTKKEFIKELRRHLSSMDEEEIRKTTLFYSEMIDDKMEDGMTEEEAIDGLGSIGEIAETVLSTEAEVQAFTDVDEEKVSNHFSFPKVKSKPSKLKTAIIILSSPIWLPVLLGLICAVIGVAVSIICTAIAVFVGFFAVVVSCFASSAGTAVASVMHFISAELPAGFVYLGLSLAFIGVGILLTKPTAFAFRLIKITAKWIVGILKKPFYGKPEKEGENS